MKVLSRPLLVSGLLMLGLHARAQDAAPAAAATASPAAAVATGPAVLKVGSIVVLETTDGLSSANAKLGQAVPMRVKYDVKVNGQTVIKAGAPASGQVMAVMHHKGVGKQGNLAVKASAAQATDGQMVPLTGGNIDTAGEGTAGSSIALAAVVSPLFLLKKGKEATIPAGFELQTQVASETQVK